MQGFENKKPVIICLTPVRNEAWMLDVFLQCTSLWADYIIIADQQSTDGTRGIASKYSKVKLIENTSEKYNELERQILLIDEARKIPGKRLLVSLDADEIFTSNFEQTSEWQKILDASEGTVFSFNWINILPGFKKSWISEGSFPWAFMDDGSKHTGEEMHSPRVPVADWSTITHVKEIKVLHFQYVNWKRMENKHLYYQCLERIKYPNKSAVEIFRTYHHMYALKKSKFIAFSASWFEKYENKGINLRSINLDYDDWYNLEVDKMIINKGPKFFHKEAIWSTILNFKDPRNMMDRIVHLWLTSTRRISHFKVVAFLDRQLKKVY